MCKPIAHASWAEAGWLTDGSCCGSGAGVMVGVVSMVLSCMISVAVSAVGGGIAGGWWTCGCGCAGLRSCKVTILSSAC